MDLTMQQLLEEGTNELTQAGIGEALLDSRYLLFEAFHTDMTHFLMDRNRKLSDENPVKEAVREYRSMIAQRALRVPLQQITGSREFMGLEFAVNKHVLIPRQDTETLVELVLREQKNRDLSLLDLCTGSGCIGLSLMALGGYRQLTAVDISKEALEVAKANGKKQFEMMAKQGGITENQPEDRNALEIQVVSEAGTQTAEFLESDLFTEIGEKRFDVIVSNPPYIPTEVILGLEPEVRDHEPRLALDGMEDGLYFYRKLAAECPAHLKAGGAVYFEIGHDQGEAVSALLKEAGFHGIRVIKDAPGLDRVVAAVID